MPRLKPYACVEQGKNITKLFKIKMVEKDLNMGRLAKLCGKDASHLSRTINNPLHANFSSLVLIAEKLGIREIPI